MRENPRWQRSGISCALAALFSVACQPSGAGLVLEVTAIPTTAQALRATVYVDDQVISEHTFDSGIAGQSSVELGYRLAPEKLGLDLRFVVEAQAGSCRLAQGSTHYTANTPERFSVPIALTSPEPLASAAKMPVLTAVHGSSDDDVWSVSTDGRLVRWDGCSWIIAGAVTDKQLNAVHVVGPDEVWAAGDDGSVVHYFAGALKAIPALIDGVRVTGAYKGIWQVAPNDVWFVGTNANSDQCLLHHYDGSQFQDFSNLCASGLGTPKVVDLTAIWGAPSAHGVTLYAGGERSLTVVAAGSSAAALIVKKESANWQPVALDNTIATKAERVNSMFGLSSDEVVLGVNYGTLIDYRIPDSPGGREIVVDAGRSPTLDDVIVAVGGDDQRNLFVLYAAGNGASLYRSRGALAPWSDVSGQVSSLLAGARSLFAPSPEGVFFVGTNGLAVKRAIP